MNAADESYARLLAARRFVTPAEREETRMSQEQEELRSRIRRKLPRVY